MRAKLRNVTMHGQKLLKCQKKPSGLYKMQVNAWQRAEPQPALCLSGLASSPVP